MTWRVVVGTAAFVLMMILLGYVLVTEQGRMTNFVEAYDSRQVEVGAALFQNNCTPCHGDQGKGLDDVGPALNAADLFNGDRLKAVEFSGTVEDYIRATIAAGRPVPTAGTNYPNRMPTWSDKFGGPLREDQIDSLVTFIMNWQSTAAGGGQATPLPEGEAFGTDIKAALPAGDVASGEALATSLGCVGCHVTSAVGPGWLADPAVGLRAETRYTEAGYTSAATTAEEYLVESIVLPNAHVVAGFNPDVMPKDYGQKLTPQNVADLVAYLLSLK